MNLIAVRDSIACFRAKGIDLAEKEKLFVCRFAYHTKDMELTEKLISEIENPKTDRTKIRQKYEMLMGQSGMEAWVVPMENQLMALEMYLMEEEAAIHNLAEILDSYGIDIERATRPIVEQISGRRIVRVQG